MHLLLIAAIGLVLYIIGCAIWPFGACRKCKGADRFASPSGKAFRNCGRCKGTGRRIRFGHRVLRAVRLIGGGDD